MRQEPPGPRPPVDEEKVGIGLGAPPVLYEARLKAEGEALVLEALAEGTTRTYQASWIQWATYARLRGMS
eukprot:9857175-Heterocapsa_arctica.AAC.1